MAQYQQLQLDNGIVALIESRQDSSSISASLTLVAGSCLESPELAGATHFVEHMLFKGTTSRDVFALAREMNIQGGRMNASTTSDYLRLYTDVIPGDLAAALELMREMAWQSTFPEQELDRERDVILEEIAEYLDSPEDHCFESFVGTLWEGHPLGRPIIGFPETVGSFDREQLVRWWRTIARPEATIVSLAGGVDADDAARLVRDIFGSIPPSEFPAPPRPAPPAARIGRKVIERDLEQVQFCMGFPCFARRDPRRYPLSLFDLILGGGMGSRLFNEVRERRGLAYTVASSASLLHDGGFLHIYGSTSPERLDQVLELCQAEFDRLVAEGPTEEEVETARHQFERSFLLALDSNPFRSMRNIDPVLYGLERLTEEEVLARIRGLSRLDVMVLTGELFDKAAPTVSLVGPVGA